MAPRRGQIELKKKDIRLGGIFWLRENAIGRDATAFDRSGLEAEALGHPVVVIDTLAWRLGYVWVCLIRGTYRRWRGDIPLAEPQHLWGPDEACGECKTKHQYNPESTDFMNALTLEDTHMPGKPRHIASRRVFEVSVGMLRLGMGAKEVGYDKLDKRSLDILRDRAARSIRLLKRRSFALAQLSSHMVGDAEQTAELSPSTSNTTNAESGNPEDGNGLLIQFNELTLNGSIGVIHQDGDGTLPETLPATKEERVDAVKDNSEGWTTIERKKAHRRRSVRRFVQQRKLVR